MRFALTFLSLGIAFIVLAVQTAGWGWLMIWPGISAAIVGAGYAGIGAQVFGKRSDGRYATWALLTHLPYLLMTLGIWHLLRLALPENPADQIAPGIWVARRPLHFEIPPGVVWIIDVTAEFPVAARVAAGRRYLCYPTLDGHICDDAKFAASVREVANLDGGVLIHCAQGHGRSAALTAAVLIARGLADDVEAAQRLLIAARPKVALKPSQRATVRRFTAQFRAEPFRQKVNDPISPTSQPPSPEGDGSATATPTPAATADSPLATRTCSSNPPPG